MSDALDAYLERTQQFMDKAAVERFGPKVFQRWSNPLFMGELPAPSAVGFAQDPKHGDTVTLFLRLEGQTIVETKFGASGCGPTIVCGDAIADLAQGKTLEQAATLGEEDILTLLETLPKDKHRCARLAVEALRDALQDALAKARP